ncbi:MAG TPA: polymer-forming cytoskeletal protein [Acidobacteriota bacterium]|nr:polymer-forming cytoskeletal protein [Acidobacteriota bacterium]HQO19135.1 polymer-forming cytoskeletal protein [Acidobacteriota bacterium]HQQ47775.1 polymer-forming cytoskeletal protein [Acidobacteriota bacterium]
MMSRKDPAVSQVGGMLGEGVKMEGTLNFNHTFRVDGEFKGKVVKSDRLVIGEKGLVSGEIEVNSIACYGRLEGKIRAKGPVEVHPKGKIEGELTIEDPLLSVLEGGMIEGTIHMEKRRAENVLPIKDKAKEG